MKKENWIAIFIIACIVLGLVCIYQHQQLQEERALTDFYKVSYEYYYELYNGNSGK